MHELLIMKTTCLSQQIPPYCKSCILFEILILINFENIFIDDDIQKNNTNYWRVIT